MKFNNIKEVQKAIKGIKVSNEFNTRAHYTIMFKKALMTYAAINDLNCGVLASQTEIPYGTLYKWNNQFKDDLYEPDAVYAVSQKSKDVNSSILKKLKQQITEISKQIILVEELEALGFTVTAQEAKTKLRAVK